MRKSRRNRLLFCGFLLSALIVSGILIFCVFLHVMVVQNELRTRELERQIELERRQQEDMRTEIASLESPGRIEKIAAERLNMAQVTRVDYLWSPSFKALKSGEKSKLSDGEAMYSDAKRGAERQN
jgi:cell division protein FtsL